jgi:hypothetical protein
LEEETSQRKLKQTNLIMYDYPTKKTSLFDKFQKTYRNDASKQTNTNKTSESTSNAYDITTDGKTMLFTPSSSWLDMVVYNYRTKVIVFLPMNGKPMSYENVSQATFNKYQNSVKGGASAGRLYNHTIKPNYKFVR